MLSAPAAVYRPRNPQSSDYYRCVEDHFEGFVQLYEESFESRYGFWGPYLQKGIDRCLECGNLHYGFARGSAGIATMNIFWPSPASAIISVLPAIRNWLQSSGRGYACFHR